MPKVDVVDGLQNERGKLLDTVRKLEQGSHINAGENEDCINCVDDASKTPTDIFRNHNDRNISEFTQHESFESCEQFCLIRILEE
jgi:hypothetical protein